MTFPLSFLDITLWLAIIAVILLITSEFTDPSHGKINLIINRNHLNLVAMGVGIIFIISILFQIG
jgi:hypothetical protein